MSKFIQKIAKKALANKSITPKEADKLIATRNEDLLFLLGYANLIRKKFRGNKVDLCAITSAKSGACPEDCAFCSQSVFYKTNIKTHPLISSQEMFKRAQAAAKTNTRRFCIVVSGRGTTSDKDFSEILKAVVKIKKKLNLLIDASLGLLSLDKAKALRESGVSRYNHNIETAESFFSSICSTHKFSDRLKTIDNVKKAGLELCCGGIFGLGEKAAHRLEFLLFLKQLNPDCIPLNFLNPVPETPLVGEKALLPLEILKIIAVSRFILPNKEIKICGGREKNLRSLQSMIFFAGADAMISGNYLTTRGAPPEEDLQMIKDLELNVRK